MNITYSIKGVGPLIFGDGRPFANQEGSLNLRGLDLPFPSTLSSAVIRPILGEPAELNPQQINHFLVRGPLLRIDGHVCFPAPLDAVPMTKQGVHCLAQVTPSLERNGTDSPDAIPQLPTVDIQALEHQGYKRCKEAVAKFISARDMVKHLIQSQKVIQLSQTPELLRERRVGVGIDFANKSAKDGELYSTTGVHYGTSLRHKGSDGIRRDKIETDLLFTASTMNGTKLEEKAMFHFGGEKKGAILTQESDNPIYQCPEDIANALLNSGGRIRLILATPAEFRDGWMPGWLKDGIECPNTGVRFELVSACIGRRIAVSGWGNGPKNWGPKPATWLVPAGSVYFLQLDAPTPDKIQKIINAWLQPVSDDSKFRRNGFGLALWGSWKA